VSEFVLDRAPYGLRRSIPTRGPSKSKLYKLAGWSLAGVAAVGTVATAGSSNSSQHKSLNASPAAPAVHAAPAVAPEPTPPAPAPAPAHGPNMLIEGATGPGVVTVQKALGIHADGVFGPQTKASVIDFQQHQGLSGDGIVGPKTQAALAHPHQAPSPHVNSTSTSTASVGQLVVREAMTELGKPYSWGSSGSSSFDCSGLTSYVFQQVHISLPRTSQAQFQTGKQVSLSNIQAGDLVFWDSDGAGASHVGIAISPTEAISAGPSQGVRVHPINQGYYASHYLGARSEF
jgi:cell wall-associated NlpC family hydrolase